MGRDRAVEGDDDAGAAALLGQRGPDGETAKPRSAAASRADPDLRARRGSLEPRGLEVAVVEAEGDDDVVGLVALVDEVARDALEASDVFGPKGGGDAAQVDLSRGRGRRTSARAWPDRRPGRGTVEIELTVRAKIRSPRANLAAATRRRSERTSARMPWTARWVASEPGLQICSSRATYSGRVGFRGGRGGRPRGRGRDQRGGRIGRRWRATRVPSGRRLRRCGRGGAGRAGRARARRGCARRARRSAASAPAGGRCGRRWRRGGWRR